MYRAGVNGLRTGVFAWADPETGRADNSRTSDAQILGFVLAQRATRFVPSGYQITLSSAGDFWALFAAGANAGDRVYASTVDGSVISGETDDAELTPWFVASNAAPGQCAIISTWSRITS